MIGSKIIHLESIDSTNNYVANLIKEKTIVNGAVILTDEQTAGRGQRGTLWSSLSGVNLLMSVYFEPANLSVENQFYLSKLVALTIVDYLKSKGLNAEIKWPNDIYVKGKKIAGVLIENQLSGSNVKSVIIGIGFNVNQTDFGDLNATSLKLECSNFVPIDEALFGLIQSFNKNEGLLTNFDLIDSIYHSNLLGLNEERLFLVNGNRIYGIIKSVSQEGKINILMNETLNCFDLKEIKFVF